MSNKIVIKSEFNNDIRRFTLNLPITLEFLKNTLKNLYSIKTDDVRLKYKDDEGDAISITSEEELNEAVIFAKENKNLLRVSVTLLPMNLSSWVFVDTLPEVQELCKDIKNLSEQLKLTSPIHTSETSETTGANATNSNTSPEVNNTTFEDSPTSLQFSQTTTVVVDMKQSSGELTSSSSNENCSPVCTSGEVASQENVLTSGGDNDDHQNNSNNNNDDSSNNNTTEVAVEIPTEIQHKREKISNIVAEYSSHVVHDLKQITEKIANLVMEKGSSIPMEIKDDLIQTNMKLAEMTISNCQTFSNNAVHFCNEFSDLALNIVNKTIDSKPKYEESDAYLSNDLICNNLRSKTIEDCNSYSSKTSENCMKGAESIRDLIMNL